jgi:hypothetical protein
MPDDAKRRRRSMPDHRAHLRRLAILRRLQAGPATWREIVEAVGPLSYGVQARDASTLSGSENDVRYSVNRDIAWLRRIGCAIPFRRGKPGEGQYVLEAAPLEMAEPLHLGEAQQMALDFLERQWAGEEGPAAEAVRSLLELVRRAAQ